MTATQLAEYKKIKAELREARTGDRFLEKSGGLLRAGVPVKARYAYIHREEGNYPTRLMCHCLEVSHSGYYAWRNRGMSETQKRREELAIFVTYFFNDSKQTYGYRRVHKILERGWCYNQSRDGAPAHAAGGPGGVSAPPQGPHHRACRRPGRASRPDRKELHSRCSGPETGGRPSPICFSPGKDSCTWRP